MLISRFLLIGKTRLSPIKITTIPELQVKAALHVSQINVSIRGEHVIWNFNPATAPLFGGFWEWIVKTCKQSIYHVLNWQRLNYEFLATIPFLTEHFLNICPLNPDSNGRQSWKHSRQTISFWVGQVWRFFIFQMRKNIKVTKKCSQWLKLTWRTSRQDGWKIVFQCTKNVNNGLRNVLSEVFTGLEESKCAIFGTMALFDFFDTLTRCGLFYCLQASCFVYTKTLGVFLAWGPVTKRPENQCTKKTKTGWFWRVITPTPMKEWKPQ